MSVGKGGRVVGSACVEKFLAALSYSLTGMGRGREKTIKYRNCSFRIVGFFFFGKIKWKLLSLSFFIILLISTIFLLTLIVVSTYSDRENPRAGDDSLLQHLSIFRLEKT